MIGNILFGDSNKVLFIAPIEMQGGELLTIQNGELIEVERYGEIVWKKKETELQCLLRGLAILQKYDYDGSVCVSGMADVMIIEVLCIPGITDEDREMLLAIPCWRENSFSTSKGSFEFG